MIFLFEKQDKTVKSTFWLFHLCNGEKKNGKIGLHGEKMRKTVFVIWPSAFAQCFILFGFGQEFSFRCIPSTEIYSAIKMTSFMGSPWLLDQDNASSHSACATTTWFHRHMWMWLTGQQICLLLNMYGPSWKEESDNDDHRLMGIWSLVSSEIGQNFAHNTFKN